MEGQGSYSHPPLAWRHCVGQQNSLTSDGQAWEIQCAQEKGKSIRGIWAYKDDRTTLAV